MSRTADGSRVTTHALQNARAFGIWSHSYDARANPLLMLEERYLGLMLPEVAGRDVLDAGCGSGRWLSHLASKKPRSLRGIDTSSAMLHAASQRKLGGVELFRCACDATPFANESIDLILSSFVLSYVEDIGRLAQEVTRIARRGCDLLLSDMHPETQHRLGWKRSFRAGNRDIALNSVSHDLGEIIAKFESLGWKLLAALEPEFGATERQVFVAEGREKQFSEAVDHPAISIMHFRNSRSKSHQPEQNRMAVTGARCAFGPEESGEVSLLIAGGRILQIASPSFWKPAGACPDRIDLTGYMLMPGLVNAHDHLDFALFPRLGGGNYSNSSQWAQDIHTRFADVIAIHRSVPKQARLWWGSLRNLLCGVTTVCHHNPLDPELRREDFPVRVVDNYGWAHSLAFDGELRAVSDGSPKGRPFIVHACEGVDSQSREELLELDRIGVLDGDAVLVHGLAIDRQGAALLCLRGASLILCPSSNYFLFGKLPDMDVLGEIDCVALGSDSPLTAEGDLLDELRFAARFCSLPPNTAWRMVTETPARILQLRDGEGFIKVSGRADAIAFRDTGTSPQERLRTLSAADVELVMIGGRVQLASTAVLDRLPVAARAGLEALWIDGRVRWVRVPVRGLLRRTENWLGENQVRLGGRLARIPTNEEIMHGV